MLLTRSIRFFVTTILWLLLVASVLNMPAVAQGQDEPGLRIRPAIIDVAGFVDRSTSTTISVKNLSSEPLAVTVSARSLVPEDELIDTSAVDRYDATKWIQFPQEDFLIEGLDTVEVPINISVPSGAVPGGHYALAVFRIINAGLPDGSGVVVNPEAGAVMLISVPGLVEESVEARLETNARFVPGGGYKASYTIFNTGNTHILPVIETKFKDSHANILDSVIQSAHLMLPNTKRTIEVSWKSNAFVDLLSAETVVSYGTPLQQQRSQIDTFIVIPSILRLTILAAGVGLGVRFVLKRAKSHDKEEATVPAQQASKGSKKHN